MVVLLTNTQSRTEQHMADPGLNESKGGAVRVPGSHHHLEGENRNILLATALYLFIETSLLNIQAVTRLENVFCGFGENF